MFNINLNQNQWIMIGVFFFIFVVPVWASEKKWNTKYSRNSKWMR